MLTLRVRNVLLLAGAGALFALRRNRRRTERLAAAALETLLNAIDANDPVTGAHVRRVANYSLILADALGFGRRERSGVERVALFHDIGKIQQALFDIIHDSDRLSKHERELIRTHPRRGADVLAPLAAFYPDLRDGVLSHHERWDGTGYPRQLRGVDIPLSARIVSIADTFDAITHRRRYGRPRTFREATAEIASESGKQFDPDLVALFLDPEVHEAFRRAFRARAATGRARSNAKTRRQPQTVRHPRTAVAAGPDIEFRWR